MEVELKPTNKQFGNDFTDLTSKGYWSIIIKSFSERFFGDKGDDRVFNSIIKL